MKKSLSLLLALAVVFALAIPAFAADGDQDVTAQYQEAQNNIEDIQNGVDSTKVISYNLSWNPDKNTIKYNAGKTTYTWNATSHAYDSAETDKGWSGDAQYTLTVTNHSNVKIYAEAKWTPVSGITVTADTGAKTPVESAASEITSIATGTGSAKTGSLVVGIKTPTAGSISSDGAKIGQITVTVTHD